MAGGEGNLNLFPGHPTHGYSFTKHMLFTSALQTLHHEAWHEQEYLSEAICNAWLFQPVRAFSRTTRAMHLPSPGRRPLQRHRQRPRCRHQGPGPPGRRAALPRAPATQRCKILVQVITFAIPGACRSSSATSKGTCHVGGTRVTSWKETVPMGLQLPSKGKGTCCTAVDDVHCGAAGYVL